MRDKNACVYDTQLPSFAYKSTNPSWIRKLTFDHWFARMDSPILTFRSGLNCIKKNFSVKLKVLGFCIFRNQLKIEINWEFSASFFFVYVVLETSYVKKVGAIYSKQLFRHFKPVFWLLKISFSKVKIFQFLVSLEDRLSWQAIVPGCVVVNGQRACLVLRWSEFESRWSLQFSCKMCVWKE